MYGLGASVVPLLVASLVPYLIHAEFYVIRVMRTRTFEREAYSYSIVLVRAMSMKIVDGKTFNVYLSDGSSTLIK